MLKIDQSSLSAQSEAMVGAIFENTGFSSSSLDTTFGSSGTFSSPLHPSNRQQPLHAAHPNSLQTLSGNSSLIFPSNGTHLTTTNTSWPSSTSLSLLHPVNSPAIQEPKLGQIYPIPGSTPSFASLRTPANSQFSGGALANVSSTLSLTQLPGSSNPTSPPRVGLERSLPFPSTTPSLASNSHSSSSRSSSLSTISTSLPIQNTTLSGPSSSTSLATLKSRLTNPLSSLQWSTLTGSTTPSTSLHPLTNTSILNQQLTSNMNSTRPQLSSLLSLAHPSPPTISLASINAAAAAALSAAATAAAAATATNANALNSGGSAAHATTPPHNSNLGVRAPVASASTSAMSTSATSFTSLQALLSQRSHGPVGAAPPAGNAALGAYVGERGTTSLAHALSLPAAAQVGVRLDTVVTESHIRANGHEDAVGVGPGAGTVNSNLNNALPSTSSLQLSEIHQHLVTQLQAIAQGQGNTQNTPQDTALSQAPALSQQQRQLSQLPCLPSSSLSSPTSTTSTTSTISASSTTTSQQQQQLLADLASHTISSALQHLVFTPPQPTFPLPSTSPTPATSDARVSNAAPSVTSASALPMPNLPIVCSMPPSVAAPTPVADDAITDDSLAPSPYQTAPTEQAALELYQTTSERTCLFTHMESKRCGHLCGRPLTIPDRPVCSHHCKAWKRYGSPSAEDLIVHSHRVWRASAFRCDHSLDTSGKQRACVAERKNSYYGYKHRVDSAGKKRGCGFYTIPIISGERVDVAAVAEEADVEDFTTGANSFAAVVERYLVERRASRSICLLVCGEGRRCGRMCMRPCKDSFLYQNTGYICHSHHRFWVKAGRKSPLELISYAWNVRVAAQYRCDSPNCTATAGKHAYKNAHKIRGTNRTCGYFTVPADAQGLPLEDGVVPPALAEAINGCVNASAGESAAHDATTVTGVGALTSGSALAAPTPALPAGGESLCSALASADSYMAAQQHATAPTTLSASLSLLAYPRAAAFADSVSSTTHMSANVPPLSSVSSALSALAARAAQSPPVAKTQPGLLSQMSIFSPQAMNALAEAARQGIHDTNGTNGTSPRTHASTPPSSSPVHSQTASPSSRVADLTGRAHERNSKMQALLQTQSMPPLPRCSSASTPSSSFAPFPATSSLYSTLPPAPTSRPPALPSLASLYLMHNAASASELSPAAVSPSELSPSLSAASLDAYGSFKSSSSSVSSPSVTSHTSSRVRARVAIEGAVEEVFSARDKRRRVSQEVVQE